MWFDARRALAELEAGEKPVSESAPLATTATIATRPPEVRPIVAIVASVATPQRPRTESTPPARADGLHPDAGALIDFLRREGPHTYGAAAWRLGWGAARAWRAEARLRAAGLVRYGLHGQAHPVHGVEQ